jgi:hypothetical protein
VTGEPFAVAGVQVSKADDELVCAVNDATLSGRPVNVLDTNARVDGPVPNSDLAETRTMYEVPGMSPVIFVDWSGETPSFQVRQIASFERLNSTT